MTSKNIRLTLFMVVTMTALFSNCQKENGKPFESETLNLPTTPDDYVSAVRFSGFSMSNEVATLGRVLFYDKNLSLNNTISCASCHKQALGFADNTATSEGFKGERTTRNSLSAANVGNNSGFFWDLRTSSLEELVLQPIANHIEMGLDNTDNLLKKLNQTSYYPNLFQKAYGKTTISRELVAQALASFVRSMVSRNSKFDQLRSGISSSVTESELRGWNLFFQQLHCSGCHNNGDLGNSGSFNIGLDMNYKDNGIGVRTGFVENNGKFKVPSLRNVALTAPYMHDGRFNTLEEVVEHYNSNVQNHPNLSSFLNGFTWQGNNGGVVVGNQGCWSCGLGKPGDSFKPLGLTEQQKSDLVAFLKILTDDTFMTDKKFSNPFQ